MVYKHGVILSPPDDRHWPVSALVEVSSLHEEEYTLPDFETIPVYDQADVESCVAHGICTEREYTEYKQTGVFRPFSKVYVYGNRVSGDYMAPGMIPSLAMRRLQDRGISPYELLPGNFEVPKAIELFNENFSKVYSEAIPRRITSYALAWSPEEIKSAIRSGYPIGAVIPVYEEFYRLNKENYVMNPSQSLRRGYHYVILYGWNKIGWKMRNSWGTEWGNAGNCILSYDFPLSEAWMVADDLLPTVRSTKYDRTKQIKKATVHHLGDGKGTDVRLASRWNPHGYDYPPYDWGIDIDGTIVKGRPLTYEGAHTKATYQKYITGEYSGFNWWNRNALSVVLAGDFTTTSLPPVMFNSLVQWAVDRMREFPQLTVEDFLPHKAVAATACPGDSWDWAKFEKELKNKLEVSGIMKEAVVYWSARDYSVALLVANKLGSCGMFCRNEVATNIHADAKTAKRLINIGGPEIDGAVNLCGATAAHTAKLAAEFALTL